jgi:hypothetical protein
MMKGAFSKRRETNAQDVPTYFPSDAGSFQAVPRIRTYYAQTWQTQKSEESGVVEWTLSRRLYFVREERGRRR